MNLVRCQTTWAIVLGLMLGWALCSDVWADSITSSQPAEVSATSRPAAGFVKDARGKLEFHARNLDIVSVLTQLRLIEKRNLVVSNNVTGTISVDLYGVTFEQALNAILEVGGLVSRRQGPFTYVYTAEEAAKMGAPRQLTTHIFHLYYASAGEVITLLKPLSSADGQLAMTTPSKQGIPADAESAGGNNFAATDTIVVVDYPEHIKLMERVVHQVDVRPRQVLIEATILAANLREDNALGIDFDALIGVDFREVGATSTAGTSLTLGQLPDAQFDNSTIVGGTNFVSALPTGGLNIGYLKNGIGVFIHALEQITDTTVLANPKVLVLNKQRGEVMVGRRDGYRTSTTTETSTIQTVEFLETGTRLIFRPYVANDGYVRLEIHPEDSTGGLTETGLPFEETAEVTTNILVKDGTTIVIGGLFRDNLTIRRGQVPWLGNLPILGAGFRRTRDESVRQEVIVLLTPHIVDDPADDEHSMEILADAEKIRVGMRQGLQWHGRERLAQVHFRRAQKHTEKGRRTLALWELNLAINLYPKFLEAIRLREELLGKQLEEPTGSAIKDLILGKIRSHGGGDEKASMPSQARASK